MQRDLSTTNPGLHNLYVGWAMMHLDTINDTIEELDNYSNTSLFGVTNAMRAERAKLIKGDAAYRDAAARLMAGDPIPDEDTDPSHLEDLPEAPINCRCTTVTGRMTNLDPEPQSIKSAQDAIVNHIRDQMPGVKSIIVDTKSVGLEAVAKEITDAIQKAFPNAKVSDVTNHDELPFENGDCDLTISEAKMRAAVSLLNPKIEYTRDALHVATARALDQVRFNPARTSFDYDGMAPHVLHFLRDLPENREQSAADSNNPMNLLADILRNRKDFIKGTRAKTPPTTYDQLRETTDATVWAKEWTRVYNELMLHGWDGDYEGWMIGWFANAFAAQETRDMKKDSEPFMAGYKSGYQDRQNETIIAQTTDRAGNVEVRNTIYGNDPMKPFHLDWDDLNNALNRALIINWGKLDHSRDDLRKLLMDSMINHIEARSVPTAKHDPISYGADDMIDGKPVTHWGYRNSGQAIFVKSHEFFKDQGGLVADWGKAWTPFAFDPKLNLGDVHDLIDKALSPYVPLAERHDRVNRSHEHADMLDRIARARFVQIDDEVVKNNLGATAKRWMITDALRNAIKGWLHEVASPNMGKFESEELYRQATLFFGGTPMPPRDTLTKSPHQKKYDDMMAKLKVWVSDDHRATLQDRKAAKEAVKVFLGID